MLLFIHELVEDEFVNDDSGEVIKYSNAIVYDDEHNNSATRKGRRIIKVKTASGLLTTVDAARIPGWFEADIGIAAAGKIRLVKLTPAKNQSGT